MLFICSGEVLNVSCSIQGWSEEMALDRRLCQGLLANQSRLVALQKFVSTTVRPTLLPYTELYHWDGCASFVSDYLIMEPLKSPITPVRKGLQSRQKQPRNRSDRRASRQDTTWKPQWLGLQRPLTPPSSPHYLGNPQIFPGPSYSVWTCNPSSRTVLYLSNN